jgi:hypothetical protein
MEAEYKDRRRMLKVKLKSLAEEARIIRFEEKRSHGWLRGELHDHRINVVRAETRATHLAYGLIRGLPMERIELSKTRTEQLWKKVRGMVEKYGPFDPTMKAPLLERCRD